jgi:hypothetical protein
VVPTVGLIASVAGRNTDVEVWVDLADAAIDVPVDLLFGNGPFAATGLALRFHRVLVI